MKICVCFYKIIIISFFYFPFDIKGSVEYEANYQEMLSRPVCEFDLKFIEFNLRLQDLKKIKITNRYVDFDYFSSDLCDDEKNCNESVFETSWDLTSEYIKCFKDPSNNQVILCDLSLINLDDLTIKAKVGISKCIHEWILNLAKSIFHSSFDHSLLKIIIRKKVQVNRSNELKISDNTFITMPLIGESISGEPWVIWNNGNPYYQDAFFDEN